MDGGDEMNPDFIAGRGYERNDTLHIIRALMTIDDIGRLMTLLSNWEQELMEETTTIVVSDIYEIK